MIVTMSPVSRLGSSAGIVGCLILYASCLEMCISY